MTQDKKKSFKIGDNVWFKVVQIVQLALLTGDDVADYFRQITVEETHDGVLEITSEYEQLFEKTIAYLQEDLENKMRAEAQRGNMSSVQAPLIGEGPEDANGGVSFKLPDEFLRNKN